MAIHILWYMPLVAWILHETSLCERSIHEEWTNVTLYNHHEFFYETLIVAIVTYLTGIIPRAILLDRAKLFELAANNLGIGLRTRLSTRLFVKSFNGKEHRLTFSIPPSTSISPSTYPGTMVLLRFLFDFALPWLAVRQGLRCNSSDTLDRM